MTDTLSFALARDSGAPLADQIVSAVAARVDERLLRPGARMPSIRRFAASHGVSPFTVVASYDRLVAQGYLESRRGAGFFVRERQAPPRGVPMAQPAPVPAELDIAWLVRSMFRQAPLGLAPGSGVLPADWLDGAAVANALRALSRQNCDGLLSYGSPHGFLPLRQQLQLTLAELEIDAAPEQLVTTLGVTQALDLVARAFCQPGDTVLVDDPAWFLMFGSFAAMGLNVVG
ncbi:MAG: aminotransferase class I/II-fold pyridoxal phosphate-dependent enzyme, partial [Burkholderiaceae bacterium]